jgi:DNA-binding NarL/FixJ family response regulator
MRFLTMPKIKIEATRKTARVLIVDDHPAVREALAVRLGRLPDVEVCGEAADADEALRLAAASDPDVAVIDIALKTSNGIDLIKRLKARNERIRMIVWSMYSDDLYAERALRAGAMGYINKEEATDKIVEAIRQVLDGKVYLSSAMTEKLLKRSVGPARADLGCPAIESLSDRELDVFRLIGQGRKTREIAAQLYLSVKTVETYRDRIREKLGLADSTELARCAIQWTLEPTPKPPGTSRPHRATPQ